VIAGLPQIAVRGNVLIQRHLLGFVAAAPPPLAITRLVDDDAVDPRLQGRLAAELMDGAEDAEENFLGKVEGFVAIAQQVQGELIDHPFVAGDELGTRGRFPGRTALNQRGFVVADLYPSECTEVFHAGSCEGSNAHGQCINLEPVSLVKFPVPAAAGGPCYHLGVRRSIAAVVLVAVVGVAGALAFAALANEREFDRLMAAGDQAVAADRPFEAIEAYSGAIALKPDSVLAHFKRGSVYHAEQELDAALRDFRSAADLDPGSPRVIESLGDVNVALGRHERAAERYEAFLALDDRNARVLYKLGLARYRSGRVATASEPLLQALAADPAFGEAHYVLGLVQRDLERLPAARKSLEEAARRAPASQTAAREALADVYLLEGDYGKAINQLEALAALEPAKPERVVAVGLAQLRAGREDAAVISLSRAVERFPDSPQVYAALGHVWLSGAQRRGDRVALNKAVEALSQAGARADASSETLAELGRAHLLAGDRGAAERALRQAIAKLPVPPDAYLQLADVTGRDGRIQEARDALLKYATLIGDEKPLAGVATQIGDYSIKLGEPALAVRWFDRAIDEAGPNTTLQVKLADAAVRAGDVARAHQVVDEGLASEPDNRALQQLKRRLAR